MAHETGTISGYATRPDGTAITQPVYITASDRVYDVDGNLAISKETIAVDPDPTTGFWQSPALPASDDTTLDPSGVTYKVSVRGFTSVSLVPVLGGQDTKYALVAPRTAAATYATYGVASVAGLTGAVTAADLADQLDGLIDGGGGGVTVQEEGVSLATSGTTLNFVGTGVTATGTGATKTITIAAGGGISGVTVQDEGTPLATDGTTLNYTGAGVTVTGTGAVKTINIPGGGGGAAGAENVNIVAATGSTETLPAPDVATVHDLTLTADCAITLPSGFDDTLAVSLFVLLRQPSSGGSYTKTASWVGDVTWFDGGTPPVVATGQDAVTGVTLVSTDGGVTWLGSATVVDPGNQGVTLTYGATVNTDASLGDIFDLTLTGNATIAAPSGLTKNKKILYRLTQDATGGRTVTWNAIFRFSTDVPTPFLSTSGNKTDYVGFIYNAADSKLDCLAVARGY